MGRTILYVPVSNIFMARAKAVCLTSTEKGHQTGAVIAFQGKILGEAPNKGSVTSQWAINFHKKFCFRKMLGIPSGQKYWICWWGCAQPKNHAEPSAIRDAQKEGYSVEGADLYLYGHWWCCRDCWNAMDKAGIKNVYLCEETKAQAIAEAEKAKK